MKYFHAYATTEAGGSKRAAKKPAGKKAAAKKPAPAAKKKSRI